LARIRAIHANSSRAIEENTEPSGRIRPGGAAFSTGPAFSQVESRGCTSMGERKVRTGWG
jgi:hypothetical protein